MTTPITGTSGSTAAASTVSGTNTKSLNANDFINLMVTQLQNQDPTQPTSNDALLSQMSQIAQLQSSTTLQTSLSAMVTQSQIGSAGNLIGKNVEGMDDTSADVKGTVTSVRVQSNQVYLQLDSGSQLQMGNVTSISPATAPAATTAASTPAAAAA